MLSGVDNSFLSILLMISKLTSHGTSRLKKKRRKLNMIVLPKKILTSALTWRSFFRVSQCGSAKDKWNMLEVIHEGSNYVKRGRKHALVQEYELFNMKQGETLVEVQKRFTHIVKHQGLEVS